MHTSRPEVSVYDEMNFILLLRKFYVSRIINQKKLGTCREMITEYHPMAATLIFPEAKRTKL